MLKLMGAVLVFGSCAALGLSARQELRRRVAADDAMLLALSLICSEISCRRAPLPEIIDELTDNTEPIIQCVFQRLQRRLKEENGLSLGYLWSATLRDQREQIGLGRAECGILCSAANYLGRYDAAEQVSRRLLLARQSAEQELINKGKLYRTCGIAAGLLIVLVLI